MTTEQIILYAVLATAALVFLRRWLRARSVRHLAPEEVAHKRRTESGRVLLLDVRTEAERKVRHIKGSAHVPVHQLKSRLGELQKHRTKEIICYCSSGNRSLTAAIILKRQGFQAAHMNGGLVEWNFKGLE